MKALLPAKPADAPYGDAPQGVTVVIPSRNGKHLLETAASWRGARAGWNPLGDHHCR